MDGLQTLGRATTWVSLKKHRKNIKKILVDTKTIIKTTR